MPLKLLNDKSRCTRDFKLHISGDIFPTNELWETKTCFSPHPTGEWIDIIVWHIKEWQLNKPRRKFGNSIKLHELNPNHVWHLLPRYAYLYIKWFYSINIKELCIFIHKMILFNKYKRANVSKMFKALKVFEVKEAAISIHCTKDLTATEINGNDMSCVVITFNAIPWAEICGCIPRCYFWITERIIRSRLTNNKPFLKLRQGIAFIFMASCRMNEKKTISNFEWGK